MKSHKETYPEQYTHHLVGVRVRVVTHAGPQAEGTVTRVVQTRFGPLAILDDKADVAWAIKDCQEVKP